MDKKNHIALLIVGATTDLIHLTLATTSTTEESCHSPALPDYIEDKKDRGVEKYIDNYSACNGINDNMRPADLRGEVISDVKPGKPSCFCDDLPDFGNYEAGAN